jgi:hypothetical protein
MTAISEDVSLGRQVLRRGVNDRMRAALEATGADSLEVFCECGRRLCATRVQVEAGFYQGVVASGRLFLVASGHEDRPSELTVGVYDGFVVVERPAG